MTEGRPAPARPPRLHPGDVVAVASPSWGGPAAFPHIFEAGLAVLRDWGLVVRELPTTRATPERLAADPRARADDLNAAFADPAVRAIVASIGGDDSIRLLPFLDRAAMAADPTILLGFSDTTTLLLAVRAAGVVSLHGPSVMAGIAQLRDLPRPYEAHVRAMLFDPQPSHAYAPFEGYVDGYRDWRDPTLVGLANDLQAEDGPRVVQGTGRVTGELFGGCLEVLDWLRGTDVIPVGEQWAGRLLFLEPSEERPSEPQVTRILRSFGALGAFDHVVGVLVGRARDHSADEKLAFEAVFRNLIGDELGHPDVPIVANLPFGHTDPQWVLPIGVRAELDVDARSLRLVEPWLA
jgi:muramoyltetrapeptide carboxypeptidase LdcA involved in peptidoglycan recycling